MRISATIVGLASLLALGGQARAALTVAPGHAVQQLPTPGVVQGGVVKRGDVLLVGQGDYGPGLESIVRIEAGHAVTIATGFGGLGGFDLADDGTLYVVDNCYTQDFGCDAATTGDTVYAIPDALTRTTPIAAADAEMLPPGSIPFPFDVLSTPQGLLVSDAAGPGAGRIVRVEAGGTVDVATGLDYAGGIAFDDPSLFVANTTAGFTGEIREFVGGSPLGALVDGLPSTAGLAVDGDGNLLLGAGGAIRSIDGAGDATMLLEGLGFAGDVGYDASTDEAHVIDFGVTQVTIVCPDADDDGVCDAACEDGAPLEDARLSLDAGKKPGAGSLKLRADLRIAGGLTADPSEDGMILQLVDATGSRVLDVKLPGGERWKSKKKNRGWRFRDKAGGRALTDVKIAPDKHDDEIVVLSVRSRKHSAVDPAKVALPLRATVALDATSGECGSSAFAGCETASKGGVDCE